MLPVIRALWHYDVAICLDFKYRSAVIPFLARIPVRAGIAHKRKLFLTHPVDRNPQEENIYLPEHQADIMYRAIGLKLTGDLTHLYVAAAADRDKAHVDALLAGRDMRGPVVAIAPFSSTPAKDWPIAAYRGFMEKMAEKQEICYMVLGGKKDVRVPFPQGDNIVDLRGRTNLMETAELLRRADYFLGGCSAPLHIATAVGTPAVALYGATSSAKWSPRHKCIVVKKIQPCTPCDRICYGGTCHAAYPCMTGITVDMVYQAFDKLMEQYPVKG